MLAGGEIKKCHEKSFSAAGMSRLHFFYKENCYIKIGFMTLYGK